MWKIDFFDKGVISCHNHTQFRVKKRKYQNISFAGSARSRRRRISIRREKIFL